MDAVDYLIKALMPEKDYFKLQKDAEIYQRIQNKKIKKSEQEFEQRKRMQRRRMNNR